MKELSMRHNDLICLIQVKEGIFVSEDGGETWTLDILNKDGNWIPRGGFEWWQVRESLVGEGGIYCCVVLDKRGVILGQEILYSSFFEDKDGAEVIDFVLFLQK